MVPSISLSLPLGLNGRPLSALHRPMSGKGWHGPKHYAIAILTRYNRRRRQLSLILSRHRVIKNSSRFCSYSLAVSSKNNQNGLLGPTLNSTQMLVSPETWPRMVSRLSRSDRQ